MEYLLDTNICIYLIKARPVIVLDKFSTLSIGSVGISSITLAELQYGVEKSAIPAKNQDALNRFIAPLEILDFDFEATLEYGRIRAGLERKGAIIG